MTNAPTTRREKGAKAHRTDASAPPVELTTEPLLIQVERSGDWMPADELREAALGALSAGRDLTLDLDRIDHLDASALQILLAAGLEMKKHGKDFRLTKASAHLHKWFEFAGVGDGFLTTGQTSDE